MVEESLKCVGELFFKVEAVLEELNIVHEEDVERAVELFHLVDRFAPQRIDDIVDEGLCGDDLHSLFFVVLLNIVANAVEEVRLSQSYTAMGEERIVRFSWAICNANSC